MRTVLLPLCRTLVAAAVAGALMAGCADAPGGATGGTPSSGPTSPGATTGPGAPTDPAASPTQPSSPSAKPGELTVTGLVVDGVEPNCLLLQADGASYLLIMQPEVSFAPRAGQRITVRGRPDASMATTCMQGTPLVVSSAGPA
ncbi:MAG TPA: hypothetical protein VNV66_18970 [Pilimelia sp.]|nr:hypothetical protein [Pilimelia sp.]